MSALATRYEVSKSAVRKVIRGVNWSHVGGPVYEPEPLVTDSEVRRIRFLFWVRGVPQKTIAAEYGISVSYVSMLATGQRKPSAGGPTSRIDRPPTPPASRERRARHAGRSPEPSEGSDEERGNAGKDASEEDP